MTKTDSVFLLDGSVLIALLNRDHEFHQRAVDWFVSGVRVATCPITEGALVRHMVRIGEGDRVHSVLTLLNANPRHEFWPADLTYQAVPVVPMRGHRMVTDAYLVALADHHGGMLATFDKALTAVHPSALLISSNAD